MDIDYNILIACKKGDSIAWRVVYNQYSPMIKGVALRYEKDVNKVSDIIQDVFVKIHTNINKYSGEGSFEGWVRRISVNACIDYVKKSKKLSEFLYNNEKDFEDETFQEDFSIVSQIINAGITKNEILNLVNSLPINHSTVFNLYFVDDWSHQQIAQKLNITESLSRKWAFRAKKSLKNELITLLNNKQNV